MASTVTPTIDKLTGRQKAALLIVSLDLKTAGDVMKTFSQPEIERITIEIANLKGVTSKLIDQVLDEFHHLVAAQEFMIQGGMDHAQKLLEQSLGLAKASEVMDRIKMLTHVRGFATLKEADPSQLVSFLQKEHPQTIALILSNLNPELGSRTLMELPEEIRNDVTFRMATLGKVSPALLAEMEDVLESITQSEFNQSISSMGGAKSVATILNKFPTGVSKTVMEYIEEHEPTLASEIKRLMFLFEDIIFIDDRGIQRMLREIDKKDLALSLKVTDEKLKQKIYSNMSERAQELLKEELMYMGPVRLKEVEAAQQRIVEIVKALEDSGEIIVAGRGGTEEIVV
ncbi:MAG: flagellar motor switch protein FliG [Ignavibacteria bacterium]|nr:flagellar motor switch protein FliG [Ignavibacteria bacterium]